MTSVAAVASPLANKRPSFAPNWNSKSNIPSTSTTLLSSSSSSPAGGAGAKLFHGEFGNEITKSPEGEGELQKMRIELLPNSPKNEQDKTAALVDTSSDCSSDFDRKSIHESGSSRTSTIDDSRIVTAVGPGSGSVDEDNDSVEVELDDIASSDEEASMLDVKENDQDLVEEEGPAAVAAAEKSIDETSPQPPPQELKQRVTFSPVPPVQRIDNTGNDSPAKSTRVDKGCQESPFTPPHDVCDSANKKNIASGLYYPPSPSRSSRRGNSSFASPVKVALKQKDGQEVTFTPPEDQRDHVKKSAFGLYYPPSPSKSSRRGNSGIASPVKASRKEPACHDAPHSPLEDKYDYLEAAPDVKYPTSPRRSLRRGVIVPGQNTVEDIIETIASSSVSRMPSTTQLQSFVKDKMSREEEKEQQMKRKTQQRKKLKQFPPRRPKKAKKGRMLGMKPNMEADGLIRDPSFVNRPAKPSNNEGSLGRSMFSRFRSQ